MQMVYNSESYVVVRFDAVEADGMSALAPGGFEIVDKLARRDIFIQGALADRFQRGVQALVEQSSDGASPDALDEYIAGFTEAAHQTLALH